LKLSFGKSDLIIEFCKFVFHILTLFLVI
jgi:hypothetical protein